MKGFPNQIADIRKLTLALVVIADRLAQSLPIDDGALGEAFLRAGIIQPRNKAQSLDDYLRAMGKKSLSNQSHRTAARGLKEFFDLAGVTAFGGLTDIGERIVSATPANSSESLNACWRDALLQTRARSNAGVSHPYQILLRLLAERPQIPRALTPLVFEAADDSESEYQRIASLLSIGDETLIRQRVGATKTNWDNAKKILPTLGVQVGDIQETAGNLSLAESALGYSSKSQPRKVTVETIAQSTHGREIGEWPRAIESMEIDPLSVQTSIAKRNERALLHNELVRAFAKITPSLNNEMWENPIDLGALTPAGAILAEMKTLDGTTEDEVHQVRLAIGQLLYYQQFSLPESLENAMRCGLLVKIAVFSRRPSLRHIEWIESIGIAAAWATEGGFDASRVSREMCQRLGLDLL